MLDDEFWVRTWSRMAAKMLPKSSKNRSDQVPDGHWSASCGGERFQDEFPFENAGQIEAQIGPKSRPDGLKIEWDRVPNAI